MKVTEDITALLLDTKALNNLQQYISIVKHKKYNITDSTKQALTALRIEQEAWRNDALSFIQSDYIKDKIFDELDLMSDNGEVLTTAKFVVYVVFPGYLESLPDIMQILCDTDNMIALSASNYIAYKTNSLQLNDTQRKLILHKQQIILNRYKLRLSDIITYRLHCLNNDVIQRHIQTVCYYAKFMENDYIFNDKKDNKKAVECYTLDGQFVAVFPTLSIAANAMQCSISSISGCCKKQQYKVKTRDKKAFIFCYAGDTPQLRNLEMLGRSNKS